MIEMIGRDRNGSPARTSHRPRELVLRYGAALAAVGLTYWIKVPIELFRLVVFAVESTLISTLMETLHRARRISEASQQEAERYQEASRRGEETLRAILDNSLAVVFLKDTAGRYILLNRRFAER